MTQGAPSSMTDVAMQLPTLGEVWRVMTLQSGFNASVVLMGTTLLGVAAGIIGSYALLRKRALMGDALSHASLPGVALGFMVAVNLGLPGKSLFVLLPAAAIAGVLGVLAIQFIVRHTRLHEDAAIGAILSVFFGAGVVLISIVQSMRAGDQAGLATFIYGQTAAMSARDVALMASVAAAACLAGLLFIKEFALVSFDANFAAAQGWPVSVIDLLMMSLVVLVTVVGLQAVGLILVVAMLIIPAASARFWTDRLSRMIVISGLIGGASAYVGSTASSLLPRLPAGAVIVLASGVIFLLSLFLAPNRGLIASTWRVLRLRIKVAGDHFLREMHHASTQPHTHSSESCTIPEMTGELPIPPFAEPCLRANCSKSGTDCSHLTSSPPPQAQDSPNELSRLTLRSIAHRRGWSLLTARLVAWNLRRRGLLERTADPARLTPAGQSAARRVVHNRQLWEQYLIQFADVAPSHVDWSADAVEHVLSAELVRELERTLTEKKLTTPLSNDHTVLRTASPAPPAASGDDGRDAHPTLSGARA